MQVCVVLRLVLFRVLRMLRISHHPYSEWCRISEPLFMIHILVEILCEVAGEERSNTLVH